MATRRTGERADAVRQLADGEYAHATATVPEAHAALISAWDSVRGEFADPHDRIANLLLMTTRNSDADVLNAACRTAAREAGNWPGLMWCSRGRAGSG